MNESWCPSREIAGGRSGTGVHFPTSSEQGCRLRILALLPTTCSHAQNGSSFLPAVPPHQPCAGILRGCGL
ncbi:hypothetical protein Micbo1qcDRAFT_74562 [Microdochium bolleyi]|uniref:Uncharacterized protein n=1 Tax=Microdochium bolleyi TaxID=196109 RepID=A0A136IZ57_9PEZI|nr:hypothetical protein Micbo1qcDRAFT_74562 [Microdochium bolleyi]